MKAYFVILFCCAAQLSFAQNKLNKVYTNFAYGFCKHYQSGIFVQGFRHLLLGVSYTDTRVLYATKKKENYVGLLWSNDKYYNRVSNVEMLAGISTLNRGDVDIAVLMGPSFGEFHVFSTVTNYSDYYGTTLSYKMKRYSAFGFSYCLQLDIAFNDRIALNISFRGNTNKYQGYYRLTVGLNMGLVKR